MDAQGRIAASFDYHVTGSAEGQWDLRLRRGEWLRQVATGKAVHEPPYIVGFSYDDKSLLVAFDSPDGWIWKPLRLADDTWGGALGTGKAFYDVIRNRLTGQVIGGLENPLSPRQVFFDPARIHPLLGSLSRGGRIAAPVHLSAPNAVMRIGARVLSTRSMRRRYPPRPSGLHTGRRP